MSTPTNFEMRIGADEVSREFEQHSTGKRVNTEVLMVDTLRKEYPELKLTTVPTYSGDLLAYAAAGHATAIPVTDAESWITRGYFPPARRLDGGKGGMTTQVQFGKYIYKWRSHEFIIYVVDGRDGTMPYSYQNNYILSTSEKPVEELIVECGYYRSILHNEVWVFDSGYWQKNKELWEAAQKSSWDDVILDKDMKDALINEVATFFDSRETYEKLKVPWKRGIIYYGPPGNGKTISIKAMMHMLYKRKDPIPTLYVRTLASFGGPESSLSQIFTKARKEAPCYLIFEDLDSIVSDDVRSYFLNEVDGLKPNDGILMVGSTNHLDRLDPGITKRPSRFDRKYLFSNPVFDQRVQYCHYWQRKLADNKDLDFPDELCPAIAKITDNFSFAYMQEAFVAALLAIARGKEGHKTQGIKDIEDLLLWKEIKKQVKILRDELGEKDDVAAQGLGLEHRAIGALTL